jgi:PAS domain S-box-containing protein
MKQNQQIKIIQWILGGIIVVLVLVILIKEFLYIKNQSHGVINSVIAFGLVCVLLLLTLYWLKIHKKELENKSNLILKIAQTSPVGIIMVDKSGVILFANERANNILGISKDAKNQSILKTHAFLISDVNDNKIPQEILPFEFIKSSHKPVFDIHQIIRWPNGKFMYVSINISPVFDENNLFTGAVATFEDITNRKLAEKRFNELYFRYDAILSTVLDIIMEVNEHKIYTWANKAGFEFFGNDVIGKDASYYFEGEQETYNAVNPIFEGVENFIYIESWQRRRDGVKRLLAWYCSVLKDSNGNVKGALSTARDITDYKNAELALKEHQEKLRHQNEEYLALNEELKEANERYQKINHELISAKEKAEESDRLKSTFLSNMSHEIRTPMNAIIGFSDFLISRNLSDEKRSRFSHLIKERSYDLLRIIEDILDISKIDAGQMKIFESETNISELLSEILEYYSLKKERQECKPNVSFHLEIDKRLNDSLILTDGQRLKQVFTNLLDNAFKFTEKGKITFGCSLNSHKELIFFVKDSGIGIPKEKQHIIFDRFRQADESLSARQYGGTGLGLSIVKGIVTLMKGKVWVESDVNKGTAFYFTLPLIESSDTKEERTMAYANTNYASWKGKTILIVEDDEANAEFLILLLSEVEINILRAANGEEALFLFKKFPQINLVLMDIRLPDINGFNLTKIMKSTKPEIIIIAQTAYAETIDIKESHDAGCTDYISKPIEKKKLFAMIDRYFSS